MDDIIVNVHTNKSRSFVKLFFNVKHHLLLRSREGKCPLMVDPFKGTKATEKVGDSLLSVEWC